MAQQGLTEAEKQLVEYIYRQMRKYPPETNRVGKPLQPYTQQLAQPQGSGFVIAPTRFMSGNVFDGGTSTPPADWQGWSEIKGMGFNLPSYPDYTSMKAGGGRIWNAVSDRMRGLGSKTTTPAVESSRTPPVVSSVQPSSVTVKSAPLAAGDNMRIYPTFLSFLSAEGPPDGIGTGNTTTPAARTVPPPPPIAPAIESETIGSRVASPQFQPVKITFPSREAPVPQRAMAPAINYDLPQYQLPELPQRPVLPQMPQRDVMGERRQTGRATLRSALLGALLGGGVGATAAMVGTQQGYQQAFDQDYAQRMAEFQNAQQQALQQGQFATQEYNQRLAMADAMLRRAEAKRAGEQQLLDVDYANQVARYNAEQKLREDELARRKEEGAGLRAALPSIFGLRPEDQAAAISIARTGVVPEGFTGVQKEAAPLTEAQLISNIRMRGKDIVNSMVTDPKSYQAAAQRFNQSILDNPNITDAATKASLLIPDQAFTNQFVLKEMRLQKDFDEDVRQFDVTTALKKRQFKETQDQNAFERSMQEKRLAFDKFKALLPKPSAAGKPSTSQAKIGQGQILSVVERFNKDAKTITELVDSMQTQLIKNNKERLAVLQGRLDSLVKMLVTESKDSRYAPYITFTIDSKNNVFRATPTLGSPTSTTASPTAGGTGSKYNFTEVK